jgi:hypothetical protein
VAKKPKVIRIDADEVMAGDRIVIKEGTIRKSFPVCEFQQRGNDVTIVYRAPSGFVRLHMKADDRVRVRNL